MARNWKNGPCTKVSFFRFCPFFFIESKSMENTKNHLPKWLRCTRKNFHLSKEKMDFWPFLWFWQNHKNGQKSIFYFERWKFFSAHLNHLGRQFFCIFYTFWFDQKNGQNWKKPTFAHGPLFQFLAQKCQKYKFSWKIPFLTIFLWVISVRKCFLYFWQTPIFEPARAILLRRVWYAEFQPEGLGPYPSQQNGSSGFKYRCLSKV